jgi:signal transduction histidine kinase
MVAEGDPRGTLEDLERRTRERWAVAALLLVAVVAAMVLLVIDDEGTRYAPLAGGAFLVVAVVFAGSVVAQERRERQIVRVLLAEHERASALGARARALETLHHAVVDVGAAESLDELYERTLRSVMEMTDADRAVVWLRVGDTVTVAASRGGDAPTPGTAQPVGDGVVGAVVRTGESLLTGPGAEWGAGAPVGVPTVAAPLRLPDRVAGAVLLQRDDPERPFSETDRTATTLFAEQAALAMRTATRLDLERERGGERGRALERRADHTASIVHDLKAPVAAIVGYVELLRDRGDQLAADRRRRMLDDVLSEALRMADLLSAVLDLAAAESDDGLTLETVDAAELLEEVARTAEGLAHRQGAPRDVEVRAETGLRILVDRRALLRVLANLVENAVAYSPAGSPLTLGARRREDGVLLRVEDRGEGLSEGSRREAFDRFRSRGGGTGLGLHVARALVEAHGGEVQLVQRPGGGTRVEVRLPDVVPGPPEGPATGARDDAGRRRR